jgi:uncharacterized protein YdcH (DUF465 family)
MEKQEDQKKIQNIHHLAQEEELQSMKAEMIKLKDELSQSKRDESKNSARAQITKRKSTLKDQ